MEGIRRSKKQDNAASNYKIHKSKNHKDLKALVYKQLLRVPPGKITTYGDLAKAAGAPGAQRAVGKIMNKNPYPGLVPCHRVIRSDGHVGGYAYGTNIKQNMLQREGLCISNGKIKPNDLKKVRYRF